jgi:hypothetical protein
MAIIGSIEGKLTNTIPGSINAGDPTSPTG